MGYIGKFYIRKGMDFEWEGLKMILGFREKM